MTQALTNGSGTSAQPQLAAETLHLRRFIEKQPACILRVGLDSTLMAVNEAALALVGAEQLAQVLGTRLTRFITPRQQDEWEEFASRVKDGAAASIECDLTDMGGTRRTILLQGVPLLDHPDGVTSMILSARDISAPRRLEMALREREVNRELDDLQRQLERGQAERQQLAVSLTEREGTHQQLLAGHAAEQARLRQTLTEQHEKALLLKDQEARQVLDGLRSDLEEALAEGQRLAATLAEREAEQQRIVAAQAAEQTRLRQTLTEQHEKALLLKDQEPRQVLDGLRSDLEEALTEGQRLAATLAEREAEQQRTVAAHAADRLRLQQALAEEHQLALILKDRETRALVESLKTELEKSLAERQRLAVAFDEREARHQQAISEHIVGREQLQRILEEERELLRREQEGRQLLGSVKEQLEASLTERQRLADALAEEHELLLQEREARQALEHLRSSLEQLQAERERLEASLLERDAQHQRIVAEQEAQHAERQLKADEQQRLLLTKEQETGRLLEHARIELQQAVDDRQRLVGLLDDRESDLQRLLSEQTDARTHAERKLAEAVRKQGDVEKSLADLRVEFQGVDENARHLEWLAAAGRAAREIGQELQTIVEAVDARTRHLLTQSSVDDNGRHVIESLRGDAIGAASLVRQIVHAGEGARAKDSADQSCAPQSQLQPKPQPQEEGDQSW